MTQNDNHKEATMTNSAMINSTRKYETREQWLAAAADHMRLWFADIDAPLPAALRVSCSWPSKGGLAKKKRTIGQCFNSASSKDGSTQVCISPWLESPRAALETLVHELVHAADDCVHGHKAAFRKIAVALGLEGKMTATYAGEALAARLDGLAQDILGDYPHSQLSGSTGKTQGTRMIKCQCEACGFIARTTQKWLDAVGAPLCACNGEQMQVEQK